MKVVAGLLLCQNLIVFRFTKEEALKELDEAFKFTIKSALKDGIKIPEPVDEDAKVRINLTIPKSVLSAIDAVTNNRSKWISDLARKTLLM